MVLTVLHCCMIQSFNSYSYLSCWTNGFIYKAEQMFLFADVSVQFQLQGGRNRSRLPCLMSTQLCRQWIFVEVSKQTDINRVGNFQEKRSYLNYKVVLKCFTLTSRLDAWFRMLLNQCFSLEGIFLLHVIKSLVTAQES